MTELHIPQIKEDQTEHHDHEGGGKIGLNGYQAYYSRNQYKSWQYTALEISESILISMEIIRDEDDHTQPYEIRHLKTEPSDV